MTLELGSFILWQGQPAPYGSGLEEEEDAELNVGLFGLFNLIERGLDLISELLCGALAQYPIGHYALIRAMFLTILYEPLLQMLAS